MSTIRKEVLSKQNVERKSVKIFITKVKKKIVRQDVGDQKRMASNYKQHERTLDKCNRKRKRADPEYKEHEKAQKNI